MEDIVREVLRSLVFERLDVAVSISESEIVVVKELVGVIDRVRNSV